MATVRAHRTGTPVGRGRPEAGRPAQLVLTLADLIIAVQDVVGPADDRLVVATVRHLLGTGRLTGHGAGTLLGTPPPEEKVLSCIVKDEARQSSESACRWLCGWSRGYRGGRRATGMVGDRPPERR
jgi:hypothetical protein